MWGLCCFNSTSCTTTHPWYDGHSTSISACRMWEKRSGFKSPRGSFTHIHLDYVRIEILSCKKKTFMSCVIFRWSPNFVSVVFVTTESDLDQCIFTLDDVFFPTAHKGRDSLIMCGWGCCPWGQETTYQRGQYHANCEWMDPLTDLCGSVVSLW